MTDGTEGLTPAQKGAITRKRKKDEAAKLTAGDTPKVADAPVVTEGTTIAPATNPEAGDTGTSAPMMNPDMEPSGEGPRAESDEPDTMSDVERADLEQLHQPENQVTGVVEADDKLVAEVPDEEMSQEQRDASDAERALLVGDDEITGEADFSEGEATDDGKVAIKVLDAGQNPVEVRVNGRVLVSIPIGGNARVNADVIAHLDAAGVEYVKIKE